MLFDETKDEGDRELCQLNLLNFYEKGSLKLLPNIHCMKSGHICHGAQCARLQPGVHCVEQCVCCVCVGGGEVGYIATGFDCDRNSNQ